MLTPKEIELGFLKQGLKTHQEMGDACGLPRLTILRILTKGQKPRIDQYEKILSVIQPEQKSESPPPLPPSGDATIVGLLTHLINESAIQREEVKKILNDHEAESNKVKEYFTNQMQRIEDKISETEQILLDHINKTDDGSVNGANQSHSKTHGGGKIGVVKKRKAS